MVFYIGGTRAYAMDVEIPLKYGVKQCIGDSMGPGGFFSLFREVPVMLEIGKEVEELCPDATYTIECVDAKPSLEWLAAEGLI
jgi:alpha-galactosidase